MTMPATARIWTREDVLALPDDGQRHELIDGELLVRPSLTIDLEAWFAAGGG